MRAISVRQPWAWQILHQGKDIENRTRNIAGSYRGRVAIHASLKADEHALRVLPMRAPEWVTAPRVFDYGVVLGVVDLVNSHPSPPGSRCCSEWAEPGAHHLVLANPRPLKRPIPCRGALGLWTLPSDVLDQIEVFV